MIGPGLKQIPTDREAHAPEAHQHGVLGIHLKAQAPPQVGRIVARTPRGEPHHRGGHVPGHRHRERTLDQRGALAIGAAGRLSPGGKGRTHGAVDGIPTEIAHEHQRGFQLLSQLGGSRGHIRQHQHRARLLPKPGELCGDLPRQRLLQLLEGDEGGGRVGTEGIGLEHPHIPAAGAMFVGHRAEGQLQKCGGQGGGEHQPPLRLQPVQGGKHGGHPGAMAVAMAADTGVNQHGWRVPWRRRVC